MNGYDAGRLFVRAMAELNGKWDPERLIHLMKTLPVKSPRHGKQLTFDSCGDPVNPMYIFRIEREGDSLVNKKIGELPPINMDDYLKTN